MGRARIGRGKKEIVSRIRVRGIIAWRGIKNVVIRVTIEKIMTEKRRSGGRKMRIIVMIRMGMIRKGMRRTRGEEKEKGVIETYIEYNTMVIIILI